MDNTIWHSPTVHLDEWSRTGDCAQVPDPKRLLSKLHDSSMGRAVVFKPEGEWFNS